MNSPYQSFFNPQHQDLLKNKTLVIAEKPSVARAISQAMYERGNRELYKQEGYIVQGRFVISWCIGHLITPLEPDQYSPDLKSWRLDTLPFFPDYWKYRVQNLDYVKKQFNILASLICNATSIINAGDPDREGQLLVDELFHYLGVPREIMQCIQRVMISDLTTEGIEKAFNNIKPNAFYQDLYQSALSRQQADWLLGMNLSRAVTLLAQKANFNGVISIGRVFTPLLAMVYKRDMEIENFVSHDYYTVFAKIIPIDNSNYLTTLYGSPVEDGSIVVKYNLLKTLESRNPGKFNNKIPDDPSKNFNANSNSANNSSNKSGRATVNDLLDSPMFNSHIDDNGQIVNLDYVKEVIENCANSLGHVIKFEERESKENPPLGYALSDLQQAMFNVFGVPVNDTLTITQSLYEKGFVTYPRTDCGYLNEEDFNGRFQIINNLANQAHVIPGLDRINDYNFNINHKSRIWNTKKVENHSAIIPTAKSVDFNSLSPSEKQVYQLVAQRYLAQFMAPAIYSNFELIVETQGKDNLPYVFTANTKALVDLGWKVISASKDTIEKVRNRSQTQVDDYTETTDANGNELTSEQAKQVQANNNLSKMISNQAVKGLLIGDTVEFFDFAFETSKTTPPNHFNDATLLSAMTNIARFVSNPEIKKILNDTDGLGTEATRAAIIEKLYNYSYCTKTKNKYIVTTEIGRGLIRSLPQELTEPDSTAEWEKKLSKISKGEMNSDIFVNEIKYQVNSIFQDLSVAPQKTFAPLNGLSSKRGGGSNSKDSFSKKTYYKSNYSKGNSEGSYPQKSSYSKYNGKGSYSKSGYSKGRKTQGSFNNTNDNSELPF